MLALFPSTRRWIVRGCKNRFMSVFFFCWFFFLCVCVFPVSDHRHHYLWAAAACRLNGDSDQTLESGMYLRCLLDAPSTFKGSAKLSKSYQLRFPGCTPGYRGIDTFIHLGGGVFLQEENTIYRDLRFELAHTEFQRECLRGLHAAQEHLSGAQMALVFFLFFFFVSHGIDCI